jgi:hypothetical protein
MHVANKLSSSTGKPLDAECDGLGVPRTGISTMMKFLYAVGIATRALGRRRRRPRRHAAIEAQHRATVNIENIYFMRTII